MTTDSRPSNQENSDGIRLRELLGALFDRKWWVISITAVFVAMSLLYALLATPVYRADAIVQVDSKVPSLPGLADVSQSLGLGTRSTEATTEIALITSRAVIGSAVDALKLDVEINPKRFPLVGGTLARRAEAAAPGKLRSTRLTMSRYGWGGEALDVFRLDVPDEMLGTQLQLVAMGHGRYVLYDEAGAQLLVGAAGQVAHGHGVVLQVAGLRAHPGMRFSLVKQPRLKIVNKLQKEVVASESGKESGILRLAYQNAKPELAQQFLQHVMVAYVRQNVERNSAEASAQLQFVKEQLPTLRIQVDKAQGALSTYQTKANSVDLNLQTKGLLDQEVASEVSIQQLRMQQAEMDRKFTRDHPAYQALVRQLAELEGRKSGLQGKVRQLPEAQQELLRLTRDLQVSNEMYTAMLNQAQQLDVARAGTVGNVRIVDTAQVDRFDPVKPRRVLIILGGAILGVFLSIGLILLQLLFNRGVEDPAQLEELGLPVYASIPVSSRQKSDSALHRRGAKRVNLLAFTDPGDVAVEAVRSLRTSLHFARLEAKNNIVLISGASPNAGKTFVSTNLAAVIAQAGQRVLVIDADMRKGTLHKVFGETPAPGLSDVLAGKCSAIDAIRQQPELEALSFITRGDVPPNPSELLMHENFTRLLDLVQGMFDLVLIDTPPILAVTDAAVIAHHAGTSFLIARFGMNQPKELELARTRFEQNSVKLKGAILNAVLPRVLGHSSYGYYEYK